MPAPESLTTRYLPETWVVPAITPENEAFFTSGRLMLQRCLACRRVQHPPVPLCTTCRSFDLEYVEARPIGTVEAVTVVHHPLHPTLSGSTPYNVVIVSLTDHPHVRIVGNVVDTPPDQVRIGMTVECCWARVPHPDHPDRPVLMPQWRPASAPADHD